mmetsp:Transcript_18074/g.44948  ORF Transcript_18074/g.44948 Transcript_18074/m.44948 type:complete len:610 (-) Transcript_18074:9424-11253(-)
MYGVEEGRWGSPCASLSPRLGRCAMLRVKKKRKGLPAATLLLPQNLLFGFPKKKQNPKEREETLRFHPDLRSYVLFCTVLYVSVRFGHPNPKAHLRPSRAKRPLVFLLSLQGRCLGDRNMDLPLLRDNAPIQDVLFAARKDGLHTFVVYPSCIDMYVSTATGSVRKMTEILCERPIWTVSSYEADRLHVTYSDSNEFVEKFFVAVSSDVVNFSNGVLSSRIPISQHFKEKLASKMLDVPNENRREILSHQKGDVLFPNGYISVTGLRKNEDIYFSRVTAWCYWRLCSKSYFSYDCGNQTDFEAEVIDARNLFQNHIQRHTTKTLEDMKIHATPFCVLFQDRVSQQSVLMDRKGSEYVLLESWQRLVSSGESLGEAIIFDFWLNQFLTVSDYRTHIDRFVTELEKKEDKKITSFSIDIPHFFDTKGEDKDYRLCTFACLRYVDFTKEERRRRIIPDLSPQRYSFSENLESVDKRISGFHGGYRMEKRNILNIEHHFDMRIPGDVHFKATCVRETKQLCVHYKDTVIVLRAGRDWEGKRVFSSPERMTPLVSMDSAASPAFHRWVLCSVACAIAWNSPSEWDRQGEWNKDWVKRLGETWLRDLKKEEKEQR